VSKSGVAYKILFEKNIEIIDLQEKSLEKYQKSALSEDMHDELLDKILTLMEDADTICDTNFSIDRLAELVQSNQKYVSQVINNALKKNFRSFLNSYRIRMAQLIFSGPDAVKYTIDSIAIRVGYKSPSTFRDAFKEITGVTPNFYLKSMQEAIGQ
jgi:AraC-like DNA-binding protein